MQRCAGGVKFDMTKPCPECGAKKNEACGRVMAEERAIVKEICGAGWELMDMFEARPDIRALIGPKEGVVIAKLATALSKAQPKQS